MVGKEEHCPLTVRRALPADIPDLYATFMRLHSARFTMSNLLQPESMTFLQHALPPMWASGKLAVYIALQDDEIVGIDIQFMSRDGMCAWNTGFLESVERFGPGKLMLRAALLDAIEADHREVDFLRGEERYKRKWTTHVRTLSGLILRRGDDGTSCLSLAELAELFPEVDWMTRPSIPIG
jgi:CelD/BcsL family acetyltransferase involved in cellulose biosynthesis